MALITGLVPLVQVYEDDTAGQVVRMEWAADADVGQQP
jgi:hypothetical protein